MTTHIMTDIETLSTRPGAVVLSVALVRFKDEAAAQVNIRRDEQEAAGLHVDPATLAWWDKQDPAAVIAATQGAVPVRQALQWLCDWTAWAAPDGDFLLWCHGATFDWPIVAEVFRVYGMPCPWPFWNVRDTRTLYDLAGIDLRNYAVPPPHVALNDAIAQMRAANAALAILSRAHQVAA